MKKLILILFCICIIGCSQGPIDKNYNNPTLTPTPTLILINTPTSNPFFTPTPTNIPTPTNTPTPLPAKMFNISGVIYESNRSGNTTTTINNQEIKIIVLKGWNIIHDNQITTTNNLGQYTTNIELEEGESAYLKCSPARHYFGSSESFNYNSNLSIISNFYCKLWDQDWIKNVYGEPEHISTYSSSGFYTIDWWYYSKGIEFSFQSSSPITESTTIYSIYTFTPF